jgi:TolA-binding protein
MKPLALAACGLLLLAAGAPTALAGAALAPDRVVLKGVKDPQFHTITDETIDEIKMGEKASIRMSAIVSIDYSDAPEAYRRGHDNRQQRIYGEAIKYFTGAMNNPLARKFWLLPACSYHVALCYLEQGTDMAAAEAKFSEYLQKYPNSRWVPNALLGLGRVLLASKKHDAALARFRELVKLAETKGEGWEEWAANGCLWQARVYLEADKPTEALTNVRKVADTIADPKNELVIQANTVKAMIFLKQDKLKEAIDLLRQLLRDIAPSVAAEVEAGGAEARMQRTEAQCYNILGHAYLKRFATGKKDEDLNEALLAFLWTVVLYPREQFDAERSEALAYAAQCFEKRKETRRATELLNELQEKYPDSPFNRTPGAGKAGAPRKETEK